MAAAVEAACSNDALDRVAENIALGSERLRQLLGAADAFQHTGDRIADVNAALVKAGHSVHAIVPERQSLEDMFLQLTEKSIR